MIKICIIFKALFITVSNVNLLYTPDFTRPLMPRRSNYFQFEPGTYLHWHFYSRGAYVPFCYPGIPRRRQEQLLFVESNQLILTQEIHLSTIRQSSYLYMVVFYRMPFYNTSGKVKLKIGNTVITLSYFETRRNYMLIKRGEFISRQQRPRLLLSSTDFLEPEPQYEYRNGFQIKMIEIRYMNFTQREKCYRKKKPLKRLVPRYEGFLNYKEKYGQPRESLDEGTSKTGFSFKYED